MRRNEKPLKRVNPSGVEVFIARWTNEAGERKSAGTFDKEGACKRPREDGNCCAAHRIHWAYEQEAAAIAAPPPIPVCTIADYFAGWLDTHPRQERTNATYVSAVRAVLGVELEGRKFSAMPLTEAKRWHATLLLDALLRGGRSASGTRTIFAVLSAMYEDAISDGRAEVNPFFRMRVRASDPRVQTPARGVTVASWDDMHRFAAAAGEYEPMVRTLADCGLRLGELLGLLHGSFCGDDLLVENSVWRGVVSPGTKQGPGRVVPVPPVLRGMLAAIPRQLPNAVLFTDPDGGVWQDWRFRRDVWGPAMERSGLKLRPHDLRHSYVSLLRAAGVDPADLAKATGHTVETATAKYTHSTGATFDVIRRAVGE